MQILAWLRLPYKRTICSRIGNSGRRGRICYGRRRTVFRNPKAKGIVGGNWAVSLLEQKKKIEEQLRPKPPGGQSLRRNLGVKRMTAYRDLSGRKEVESE